MGGGWWAWDLWTCGWQAANKKRNQQRQTLWLLLLLLLLMGHTACIINLAFSGASCILPLRPYVQALIFANFWHCLSSCLGPNLPQWRATFASLNANGLNVFADWFFSGFLAFCLHTVTAFLAFCVLLAVLCQFWFSRFLVLASLLTVQVKCWLLKIICVGTAADWGLKIGSVMEKHVIKLIFRVKIAWQWVILNNLS